MKAFLKSQKSKNAFKAIITTIAICTIYRITNTEALLLSLSKISPTHVTAAFLLNILGTVALNSAQIYENLKNKTISQPNLYIKLLEIDFQTRFYALFMPAGLTAAVRWKKYHSMNIAHSNTIESIVVNKLQQFSIIFMVAGYFFAFREQTQIAKANSTVIGYILISLASALIIVTPFCSLKSLPIPLRRILLSLSNKIPLFSKKYKIDISPATNQYTSIHYRIRELLKMTLWSVGSFLLTAASLYIICSSLNAEISWLDACFVRAVVSLALMIPISVAGIGFRELSTIGALHIINVPTEIGLACGMTLFIFQILISIIGGVMEISSRPVSPESPNA
ncbi:YbhN family protein [Pseudomonas sp. QL9]|uniref:lysylphosphatidylglycerol synthase transmembrane domain-containing protein n=1 Tax=Pseudomonas sp. QL9 TaxID=3242725 RepID=UPI00352B206D